MSSKVTEVIIKHAALVARAGGIQAPCDRCALLLDISDVSAEEWETKVCSVCPSCTINKEAEEAEETANKENEQ